MMFRPLGRRVLIRPVYDPDVTPSGLILPRHSSISPEGIVLHESHNPLYANQGVVVAVPTTNGHSTPIEVAVGEYVIFSPYSADIVKTADEALVAILAEDILAVVDDEPEEADHA